ncbi:hypothetical protein ONS95_004419 [Cadophora gregata]|uniref:uncharacterized protein n=1 Tax=Cadophora gregata TaxID=51156 RepID=UPI0026DD9076|nr:uncharacterized protein ONS95_004419 [Cadophora gregata]KAK0105185.1 hypothetical protein ONS96_004586 [Cadophora gregata f. sp. sojae]KAK0105906.1 hypothetical protein ONS95_004419 [Cadophora gregata]
MLLPQVLQNLMPILVLAAPALACVQFSIDYTCPGTSAGSCYNGDLYNTNAGLTDNGSQVCSLTNRKGQVPGCNRIGLSCIGGYSAYFDENLVVHYAHGSFSGSFGTVSRRQGDHCWYTATVWC